MTILEALLFGFWALIALMYWKAGKLMDQENEQWKQRFREEYGREPL